MHIEVTIIAAAVIVAVSSTVSAIIVAHMADKQRRAEIVDERNHRDHLAEIASKQAGLLLDTNVKVAERTLTVGHALESKLDAIHTLVNSELTAAKQAEYDAVAGRLTALREAAAAHQAAGDEPDEAMLAFIDETEHRRAELESELVTRRKNDETARMQAEAPGMTGARRR